MPEGLQPCAPCSAVSLSLRCWDLPACRLWLQCWSFLVGALLTSWRPTDPSKLLVVSWDDFEASETPQCALRYPRAYADLRTQQTLPGSPAALQGALNYAQTSSICSWVNEGLPHAPQRSPRAPHPTSPCPPATLLITPQHLQRKSTNQRPTQSCSRIHSQQGSKERQPGAAGQLCQAPVLQGAKERTLQSQFCSPRFHCFSSSILLPAGMMCGFILPSARPSAAPSDRKAGFFQGIYYKILRTSTLTRATKKNQTSNSSLQ